MLIDSFTSDELAIWRKHFNGEELTRAEKRRLTLARKRDLRNFVAEIGILSAVVVPVIAFVVRICVW